MSVPTLSSVVPSGWATTFAGWLQPLGSPGLAALGIFVAALVLARFLVLLPGAPWGIRSRRQRRLALAFGLVGTLLGSLAFVLFTSALPTDARGAARWDFTAMPLIAGMAVALVVTVAGSILLSIVTSSRLALSITARDEKGEKSDKRSSAIIARLSDLAGTLPQGIEVPRGTDVTALSDALLTSVPGNSVVKAIQAIIQGVFGFVPWHVTVDAIDATSYAVVITRNGRAMKATTITPTSWHALLEGSNLNLDGFTAALILATLAKEHPGFDALCGASEWRSIGLHYSATAGLRGGVPARTLLTLALGLDPENLPAVATLMHNIYRDASTAPALAYYMVWLNGQSQTLNQRFSTATKSGAKSGYLNLHRRLLFNYLIAAANYPPAQGSTVTLALGEEVKANTELFWQLLAVSANKHDGLGKRMQSRFEDLRASVTAEYPMSFGAATVAPAIQPVNLFGFNDAYNSACRMAKVENLTMDSLELTEKLKLAVADPNLRNWAREDPTLESLRGDPRFQALVGVGARSDFWTLQLFAANKDKLRTVGVSRPAQLDGRGGDDALRQFLGLSAAEFEYLSRLAHLIHASEDVTWSHPTLPGSEVQVEVVDELIARGVQLPRDLRAEWVGDGDEFDASVARAIKIAIASRTWIDVDFDGLVEWMRLVRLHG